MRKGAGVQRSGLFLSKATVSAPVCVVLAAASALVVSYVVLATSQATVPQYQRRDAAKEACKAAGDEISRLRLQSPLTFIDDCLQPKVTPVSSKPGHLIVTRVAEIKIGRATARRTYSALMDGAAVDGWRMIRVESAPNALSVVFPPAERAGSEELAERSRPGSDQSH
jgi:hypothetical protein